MAFTVAKDGSIEQVNLYQEQRSGESPSEGAKSNEIVSRMVGRVTSAAKALNVAAAEATKINVAPNGEALEELESAMIFLANKIEALKKICSSKLGTRVADGLFSSFKR